MDQFMEVDFDDMVEFIYSRITMAGAVISKEQVIAVLDGEIEYLLELVIMGDEDL